jgi:uncharacterized membrane protein
VPPTIEGLIAAVKTKFGVTAKIRNVFRKSKTGAIVLGPILPISFGRNLRIKT